ncbi:MAG: chromosome segregation protein SMC [Candidatus Aquicultorales bacterium]
MYLKSLSLRGFKSFAERTTLKFEPGITAIVGPNGSGKSNVTDAVLWVLGEQSPRTLRGGSMEDVIFAGSATRQSLSVAEVGLTLDNSDGDLAIEFSEVTIARRVYRSGESEYYINNSPCRLLDIHELLSGSGLGRGLYSIIGQGRIDEALQAKPEERRRFIEEAAGVLKYKRRRDRAVKRLAAMDSNLVRIRDILGEVNRQLTPLRRQAAVARDHRQVSDDLKRNEMALAVLELRELQAKWTSVEVDEAVISERLLSKEIELAKVERELEETEKALERRERSSGALFDKRRMIQSVGDRLAAVRSLVEEKARNASERLESFSTDSYRSATRKLALDKRVQQLERELEQLTTAASKLEARASETQASLESAVRRSAELTEAVRSLEEGIAADERAIAEFANAVSGLDLALGTGQAQLQMVEEQRDELGKRIERLDAEVRERGEQKEALDSLAVEAMQRAASLEDEAEAAAARLTDARSAMGEIERSTSMKTARIQALEETLEDDPDAEAAKELLGEAAVGILEKEIEVDPEYERALEAVLGHDLFCLAVRTVDAVKKLSESEVKRVSLMPLDRARTTSSAPTSGLVAAASVVRCSGEMRKAVDGLLEGVFIARTLDEALGAEGAYSIVVTLDGRLIHRTGKVVMGRRDDSSGFLARRREISELKEEIRGLATGIERERNREREADQAVRAIQVRLEEARAESDARQFEVNALAASLSALEGTRASLGKEFEGVNERAAALRSRLEGEADKLGATKGSLSGYRQALVDKKEALAGTRDERERALKEEANATVEENSARVEFEAMQARARGAERTLVEVKKERDALVAGVMEEEATAAGYARVVERSKPLLEGVLGLDDGARECSAEIERLVQSESMSLGDLRKALQTKKEEASTIRSEVDSTKENLHETEIVKAQLEVEVTAAVSKIVDELDVPLERALETSIEEPREELREKVARLKRRLVSMGPVNPMAIEEHRELEERAALFSKQIEDITESRRALGKIIKAIDKKIKELFTDAFEDVSGHFKEMFAHLFPGGTAELLLTEPDDPDISGVDIIAQPSGKKLQRISLLSGGEKSLVSLAFLFSLYRKKPCPFYILDEAEAALDDANLHRLNKLLAEMKRTTQFLVITHQRRTMEMSDALYGVTMQADGVSKLVSQKLAEAVEVVS